MRSEQVSVLVVDDRPDKLLALETVLESLGHRIVKASSGTDALRVLLQEDFAVILLDVSMPGLDGFETASLIRQRPRSQNTPIIFVTSINTNETHVTRGYSLGAVDYIFSPIEPEILRAKVGVFIELFEKSVRIEQQALLLKEQAELRAEHLEHRLERLLDTLNVGVLRLTIGGELLDATSAVLRLLDCTSLEELRQTELGNTAAALVSEGRQGFSEPVDIEIMVTDGARRWLAVHWYHDEDLVYGPVIECLIEDISARKNNEAKLQELNDTLERKVEERAAALRASQEHLRRAERLASLGTLAAGIAHEINNPLNSILMTTEFALQRKANPVAVQEGLEIIAKETERCGRIIKGVLQFARNEKKEKVLEDVNHVVFQAAELLRTYLHTPLLLELQLSATPLRVMLNSTELEQVIINIVQNAAAVCASDARVVIATEASATHAILRIKDNGPGISPEIKDSIFDPFFSTRLLEGGTGLGLSVVHGIVADHEGTISVVSEPGYGAEFIVELPFPSAVAVKLSEPFREHSNG